MSKGKPLVNIEHSIYEAYKKLAKELDRPIYSVINEALSVVITQYREEQLRVNASGRFWD